jgi:hypothetical protein
MFTWVLSADQFRLTELSFEPLDDLAARFFAAPLRGHEVGVFGGSGGMTEGEVDHAASDDGCEQLLML